MPEIELKFGQMLAHALLNDCFILNELADADCRAELYANYTLIIYSFALPVCVSLKTMTDVTLSVWPTSLQTA